MTPGVLLELSADELVSASERLVDVATEFRSSAMLLNLDTPADKLLHLTRGLEADVARLVLAAVSAARASERVAVLAVLQPAESKAKGAKK